MQRAKNKDCVQIPTKKGKNLNFVRKRISLYKNKADGTFGNNFGIQNFNKRTQNCTGFLFWSLELIKHQLEHIGIIEDL
jgi:hypothetical protein